jgi:hypothetical protein
MSNPNEIPFFNKRPTQPPLNRDQQKAAFDALRSDYFREPPPTPKFEVPQVKEYKLGEKETLVSIQQQFAERGMQAPLQQITEVLEEKKQQDTVKQFYCRHVFQTVQTRVMLIPVKYKICSKCGLVK